MKPALLLYGCLLALMAISAPAVADALQSHTSIQTSAEKFITEKVLSSHGRVPIARAGSLDSRLRLKECDQSLEAFQPAGGRSLGNTTVGVRCPGTQPWTLYVPVKVSIHDTIVVAVRPLSKGTIVQNQDVELLEKDLAVIRSGYYKDLSQVIGQQVVRTISMGTAITTPMVKPQLQIRRGQHISLVAESNGFKVRMTGEALTDGASGERIQVRNLSTRKVVEGIVHSATTVQIAL
ncbi:MAG: flagellar basal body P-ring formation chaperone FlgA [Gammaproteobacteria bacterium]|jgi:flagella basal body P-ring formation protein FlgA